MNLGRKDLSSSKTAGMLTAVVAILVLAAAASAVYFLVLKEDDKKDTLILATTTSTRDTGLLDYILPIFQDEYDCEVKVTAVGTGQALALGQNGDADVVLVHSPISEKAFVASGYGKARYMVMYNWFVVVGPESDPAGIYNTTNATAALQKIYANESKFVSRGDDSGTHKKEQDLWKAAGYNYTAQIDVESNDWYLSVGAGMGDTLMRADEMLAYTLSDDGTFYSFQDKIDLKIMTSGDKLLKNQYSVIPVNNPDVNQELAQKFADWLVSSGTQQLIASFQVNGHNIFTPNATGGPA